MPAAARAEGGVLAQTVGEGLGRPRRVARGRPRPARCGRGDRLALLVDGPAEGVALGTQPRQAAGERGQGRRGVLGLLQPLPCLRQVGARPGRARGRRAGSAARRGARSSVARAEASRVCSAPRADMASGRRRLGGLDVLGGHRGRSARPGGGAHTSRTRGRRRRRRARGPAHRRCRARRARRRDSAVASAPAAAAVLALRSASRRATSARRWSCSSQERGGARQRGHRGLVPRHGRGPALGDGVLLLGGLELAPPAAPAGRASRPGGPRAAAAAAACERPRPPGP